LACVCFWWNPVVWWARYNLRANEEICCDALVVRSLGPKRDSYAVSLLAAIECLVHPALRVPAMASEINSGGVLERRFRMIVSGPPIRKTSTWLTAFILLCAMVVLPLGLVYAHNDRTGMEQYFSKLGITEGMQNRIRDHLEENGVSNNQMEQTLGGMLRIVHEMQAEGEDFELDPKLRNYFENEVGLANEQIELVQAHVQRIVLVQKVARR
jgi:hypothetical protein